MSSIKTTSLKNKQGMVVELLNLGARVVSIKVPVKGRLVEMTVTLQKPEAFLTDSFYLGATCGPVTNRIANAQFSIDNVQYPLSANNGTNCLHGGDSGFSSRYWKLDTVDHNNQIVKYSLALSDLEDGFPGNRVVIVEYHLTSNNRLEITYTATTDKATPINMTNHTYFSLGQPSCLQHQIKVSSSAFLERLDDGCVTGEISNTCLISSTIRSPNTIADIVKNCAYPQVIADQGLDHCFLLDNGALDKPKIELCSKENGVKLSVFTDQIAAQIYTGNYLAGSFIPQQGVCVECHAYVDAVNQSSFASIVVLPSDIYSSKTVYQFSVESA